MFLVDTLLLFMGVHGLSKKGPGPMRASDSSWLTLRIQYNHLEPALNILSFNMIQYFPPLINNIATQVADSG